MTDQYWPDYYMTPAREDEPNWGWLQLWEQSNPCPRGQSKAFDAWYEERRKVSDRIWVAWCLPQFQVFDWSDEDVALGRELIRGHVCGVCGRTDDPGCVLGC